MDILTEIIEVSDEMIDALKEENFFEETPFIDELKLKRAIQIQMQYNWEQTDNMYLNDEQFFQIVTDLMSDGISNGLSDLIESGHVQAAVNPNGEIVYSLTGKPLEL
jgi:uncharacterized protein YjgD (DUF1641 family)